MTNYSNSSNNSLSAVFQRQSQYQNKITGLNLPVDDVGWFSYHTAAIVEELGELLKTDKRWKTHRNAHYNRKEKLKELADVFITMINLSLFSGFTSTDVYEAIMNKIRENILKVEEGSKFSKSHSESVNVAKQIASNKFKHDIYLASPFFNLMQEEREEGVKKILRKLGFKVFSPKENCFLPPDADLKDQQKVFQENCDAIKDSMAVFAITDGKDMGTIWEAGFAYGIDKPVIYFAETLGDNGFNLMLAQSGNRVFLSRKEITRQAIIDAIFNKSKFNGLIE